MRTPRPTIEVGLAALVVFSSACGSTAAPVPTEPPANYPHAYAAIDCGPADGPALTVYLSAEPMIWPDDGFPRQFTSPLVTVSVWRLLRDAAGKRFTIEENSAWGVVSFCSAAGACAPARTGSIRLGRLADGVLDGEVDVRSPTGEQVRGTFRAAWKERQVFCG